jgi:hypothetical protein
LEYEGQFGVICISTKQFCIDVADLELNFFIDGFDTPKDVHLMEPEEACGKMTCIYVNLGGKHALDSTLIVFKCRGGAGDRITETGEKLRPENVFLTLEVRSTISEPVEWSVDVDFFLHINATTATLRRRRTEVT